MTRRKVFIAFAAAVMILVLTAALFVACDQTKTYTVTFKNGETVIKTVSVQDGATIADADVPADLEDTDDAVFEGWFNGDDVAFDKTAAITSDVTYTAKWTSLFTVTFKDGDEVIATAKVKDGEKIADADIPADLADTADAAFEGWFNGDSAFDKDAAITANVTYNAKWTGLFNVTFMNGDTQVKAVKVKDGAVISAEDVPGALADTDFAFLGWFVGDVAYDSSVAVTSNIVVNAKFSTFFKSYFGTWHGATDDWDAVAYTVVVDATSINVTIGSADAQVATSIEVDEDGTVMFKLGETDYMLYEYYDGNLHIIDTAEIALSAELAGRVHVSSSDIVGTYTTEGGHTIVINKTFVKVDGVLGTGFYYSNYSGYSWSIGDNYSSLAYDSSAQAWIYKENYNSEDDKLIVPELVAIDIPAEFVGNWYGTVESFGRTSYFLVKVTADGVFAYTPSTGYAKVGVATDYKDGALTIVGLDETITASIVDGKLKYVSDAAYGGADYELTKGTVVVFEHEYSVYYIATVGADGKIDQDTFALEDPQVAAGYTFKGWLSDLDYVTEFDEDATFAESAVFQSSVEKTGYVLTFKKSSSDSDPIIVIVEKSVGKLTADQIPAALTYEDGSVFTGWYTTAGVKAEADLAITADTTFIAKSVKESDYEGYWLSTTSGKEAMAIIADGKVTFGDNVNGVEYAFNASTGAIEFTKKIDYTDHKFTIVKTSIGVTVSDYYCYNKQDNEYVTDYYELAAPKSSYFTKTVAGTYQCNNSEIIVVLENGIVSKFDGSATTYGYLSGTKNDLKIVYKTGRYAVLTTKTGSYDSKSLILGGKIYVKGATAFTSYYNSDKGYLYAYTRDGKATLYTYRGTSYATIDGELAIGNIVTVSYTDADGKAQSFVAKITSASAYDVAGAERGTFTADGKDSITFDGFGSATIGDKAYTYVVNKNNIVVLKSDSETIGVTLDSEAKTYAAATSDGFVHSYTDANNSKYTVDFDGFGGVTITYKSSYSSVYSGTYTLGTNTVTIKGATYSYNKEYSVEESGSVLASTDGKVVLAVAGYVVENKIEQFKGYWVKDSDTIEITLDSSNNASVSINGASAIKAKANWNGSVLTFTAKDSDNSNATLAAKGEATYTLTIVDGKLVISHFCVEFDADGFIVPSDTEKTATYEVGSKADDGFEGTYKKGSDVIVLDGKGAGTFTTGSKTYNFTYTVSGSTLSLSDLWKYDDGENTLTITADGLKASFSGDSGGYSYEGNFTKEAETLDAFAGTWSGKIGGRTWTIVIDGKGNFTANGTAYHYTVDSATTASSVEADGSDKYFTFTLKNGSLAVERYDEDMYETYSGTLTKQA